MSVTINGTSGVTFNDASNQTTAATGFGFKNRIINGAMVIDQRNAGASVTSGYPVDRFQLELSQASKLTAQQNAGSVTPSVGFANYLGITSSSAYAITSTDYFLLTQRIEGYNTADLQWGSANAKTVTLSFQVYSSLTGTFSGTLFNGSSNRGYVFQYTISSANTWTPISVTIAGDTTGTWNTTNGMGIAVRFCLGSGSTRLSSSGSWSSTVYDGVTGTTSVVGTNGATFYITGVQLEKGSTATSFDYRPYGTELALCQRYCEVVKPSGATTYAQIAVGQSDSSTSGTVGYFYQVAKRAAPTVTYDTANKYALTSSNGSATAATSITTGRADVTSLAIFYNVASGFTAGHATRLIDNNTSNPITIISAEL
jgi:hypothetical protein